MALRNREGRPVDPVPFLVVAAIVFAVCYSFGPMYFVAFGVGLPWAIAGSSAAFLAGTGVAYHRLVRTAYPEVRGEVSAGSRLGRMLLIGVLAVAGLALLSLYLVAG
jgi:hypothetical protein